MNHTLPMVLALAMLASACGGNPTTRTTELSVGSSFASLNKLANTQETAIGNISVDDLRRFSASGQLTFLGGGVRVGLCRRVKEVTRPTC